MLDALAHPDRGVVEGREGEELAHAIGWGWLIGVPLMWAVSAVVLLIATGSAVWTLLVAGWGAAIAGPYFGGLMLVNRGELGADHEADLEPATSELGVTQRRAA